MLIELLIKFADDTKGFKEINGPEDRKSLQETLDNLYEWARIWGMSFNVKKCKIMHIGHKNPNYEYFPEWRKIYGGGRGERYWCASPQEPETHETL